MRLILPGIASILCSSYVLAQSPPPTAAVAGQLRFEVASVKQNKSGDQRITMNALPTGRITAVNVPLNNLIRNAYQLQPHEMVEGSRLPSWVNSDRWDIVAQAPPNTGQLEWRAMLQNLLVERFRLVLQREVREMPSYALVVARSDRRLGPQLTPSALDCAALDAAALASGGAPGRVQLCGLEIGPAGISGRGVQMSRLVRGLSPPAGRYVVDATGLTERFDLELKWTDPTAAAADPAADTAALFTAVQEQLGLRLEPRQLPINVLVIESAERPQEN